MKEIKFKTGDRVLCTDNGKYGSVGTVDDSDNYSDVWYEVLFDDGEETWLEDEYLELTDIDKNTAFLQELKDLMERYDVIGMGDTGIYELGGMGIAFRDGSGINYDDTEISPENIFGYIKLK